jgi:hypothetical protein
MQINLLVLPGGATRFSSATQAQQQARDLDERLRSGDAPSLLLAALPNSLEQVVQAVRQHLHLMLPADLPFSLDDVGLGRDAQAGDLSNELMDTASI